MAESREVRAQRLEAIKRENELKEMAGCTFAPAVRQCPSYVKRMASAHRSTKLQPQRKAQGAPAERPDWR